MSGIVFLRTREFERVVAFYRERIGMTTWLEQPGIAILRHGNLLLGFNRQGVADTQGVFTFFYETRAEVDAMHGRLADVALGPPKENPEYRIYHFYGQDPEGRSVEFQQFLHPVSSLFLPDVKLQRFRHT
ncbi:VOC family protein [candidate division WOR-3 bacterium]|uniref:VOC family protein n=1 Tax=candidate division WOR-3 bacterium TaxID=2052148 RepID=A0A937XEG5_UNCW3|nr:VOC family protein [candidate division WOR-3 bacterium]